ncbi:circularly permuted type 2 ATP-grasp protein [Denitromonas iodatirespirans]|uniref:Circularly permuted type 2 ATP-grasp protein n=1 Tax=Denitromonas iodatirespirans TaxID=2795389 RepID=A0A944H6V6_DENI1|nr:circularly permuted type 2 ATP-grasp protein [Denitromonas iodatirespirans]MBT0959680.1 circularly permuted type 2 ATP-grasp protein [Denitromonas iodatirespirans]
MPTLLDTYAPPADRYDELLDAHGKPRAHWRPLVARLDGLGVDGLDARAQLVADSILSDGISYNVHAEGQEARHPWELDPLPLVIAPEEWHYLSEAVAQRAGVLNATLADLYGPQHLLAEGLLPPALAFGQPGYKWPCVGIRPPGGIFLNTYAVDLARGPDGKWWVIADHTRSPAGAGYSLQNRIILAKTFPDAFRQLQVHPLSGFFRTLLDGFARLAPSEGEPPLVVLLTPGPGDDSYFEHAFLARYLGYPLVEGRDLTVRDNTVYLKTLRGLRRVHGILRRLDDDLCDPLELRADSAVGVPGLLAAVRAGRVLVSNALGSGVLETGALFGFLPGIAERLTGEALSMPSVASWWCGEAAALDHVIAHLDDLVIKPAFSDMSLPAVFGHTLEGAEREDMIARLRAQPHAYVAQEWIRMAQAPTWGPAGLQARTVGLRLFACATPEGYAVMPGALGRVAASPHQEILSMPRGGVSKDVWVRAAGPVRRVSLLKRRLGVIDLVCGGSDVPSRVGDNLFWMGRYTERSEATARLLRATLSRLSTGEDDDESSLPDLLAACHHMDILAAAPDPAASADEREKEVLAAVCDPTQPGSLASMSRQLSYSAGQVRERMSSDNWHALNRMARLFDRPLLSVGQALAAVDRAMLDSISLAGFALDDMTRDEGWRFLILGRRIERLHRLAALIEVVLRFGDAARERSLEWLLEATNAIVTYRARYRRVPEVLPVIHLLVFDDSNPHAVIFQINELDTELDSVARDLGHPRTDALHAMREALHRFDLTRFEADDNRLACRALAEQLERIADDTSALSETLHKRYFTHTAPDARTH